MLRDVFYFGKKPNVHPRERPAKNLEEARLLARTEHFWIVNEFCDYTGFDWDFDFDFLPDTTSWHGEHNNAWPSIYQKDSGTWLCPKEYSQHTIYRDDVKPLKRFPDMTNWVLLDKVDKNKFDFAWHPDPTEPPFTYKWGCKFFEQEVQHVLEYRTPGAFQEKWMEGFVELEPNTEYIVEVQEVDKTKWDISWRPDPREPAYIYIWGNKYIDGTIKSTWEYHTPGATEKKYMSQLLEVVPEYDRWVEVEKVDRSSFDFSWRPDPREPAYIYVWGNKYYSGEYGATLEYHTPGATERKYMTNDVGVLPLMENYKILQDVENFDFSWRPNPKDPPYIYVFGNQYYPAEIDATIEYHTPGATERKYVNEIISKVKPNPSKFTILHPIDTDTFDFAWRPNPKDPPYIYVFGNQWRDAVKMPTVLYKVEGATEYKYITDVIATLAPNKKNWKNLEKIDDTGFDYSWVPDPNDPPYIYEFGTQWQKCGGPQYVVENATQKKYIDTMKAVRLPNPTGFQIAEGVMIKSFDFSWHPDETEEPYIYVFGNNLYPGKIMPTVRYVIPGATNVKFIDEVVATLAPNINNWVIPDNVDISSTNFDFSWIPNPKDPPYIYEFGTQWQKNGGPKFIVEGATERKYIDFKVQVKPTTEHWHIESELKIKLFDYSWHPDTTEEPYIYVFGNNQYPAEIMPTIKYIVPGATEVKYVHDIVATLDQDMTNWIYPNSVDIEKFDFSWKPNPKDPPYIYKFGTQWQKNGGPNYVVEGATEIKYVDTQQAVRMPDKNNWTIPKYIDVESFDFSWHPDESEPAYIYEFGTQWQKNGGPRYVVPGATEIKYIDTLRATALPDKNNWFIPNNIDESSFDFNWHPDSTEEPYIYEFATIWNDRGGPRYIVPGATEKKYITDIKARTTPTRDNWNIVIPIEETKFDFSWVPHPEAPPYIYVFGNQWNRSEKETTVEYIVPGATEKKYIDNIVARVSQDKSKFKILHPIIETSFDFSWRPDPYDDPYIYVFGNNRYSGELMPTVEYHVENATERKYIEKLKATLGPTTKHWHKLLPVDDTLFDYSWVPNPKDPPYIYVFGSQWHDPTIESALEYRVPDATEYKYVKDVIATILPDKTNYKILIPIVEGSFDFSWRPNPKDPPYIYVFGNQWFSAEKEATIEYHVEGATERKYMNDFIAEVAEDFSNWEIPESVTVDTFDFSWRPDPGNPPYIYQFGTLDNDNDGPRYIHPNNTGEVVRLMRVERKDVIINDNIPKYYIETDLDDLIDEHKNEIFWALNKNINYDNFDFNWRPSIEKARYIHVFGSPESELTQTYFVSGKMYQLGHRSFNFVEEDKKADSEYLATLFKPSDVFFIDRNNPESNERFEKLKLIFPNITKTRYLNSWVDTIQRCIKRSSTQLAWILNSELDYTNFNFKYYPNPWQMKMVHVFGTQWSHWGTTFMVNKDTFAEDTKYIKIIEHLSNLNFVKTHAAVATNCLYDMYIIDHGNKQLEEVVEICKQKAGSKNVEVIKYEKSYLDTFKRILTMVTPAKENYIWITSSVCNYGNFDFSFICDPFAKDNLHVFPSNFQKFGDTFLVDVNKLQSLVDDMNLLEDYGKIQYAYQQRAERYPAPVFVTEEDTHRNSTKFEFDFPYAIVKTKDNENLDINYTKPISLWTDESKNIEILSTGGTALVLPKEVKNYVTEELYDYPYISKIDTLSKSRPLDIVFLSNGESVADKHFDYLLKITKGLQNRVVRVDGVNGRAAAYHAAAEASNTPWFFAVFAKLEVNNRFNFNWQPDRLQVSKHYIFNALNPVNGLTYGHQAMIAYNKKLVLNNPGRGLDFTLDDEHEVVDLLSGIARFNTDKFSTWRTAFREVIKLKSDYKDVSYDRLQTWLNKAEGDYAEDCLLGAKDGVEYYNQVGGDIEKLKLSYEWEWLNSYYRGKYK